MKDRDFLDRLSNYQILKTLFNGFCLLNDTSNSDMNCVQIEDYFCLMLTRKGFRNWLEELGTN